jgi:hypothetical protein
MPGIEMRLSQDGVETLSEREAAGFSSKLLGTHHVQVARHHSVSLAQL